MFYFSLFIFCFCNDSCTISDSVCVWHSDPSSFFVNMLNIYLAYNQMQVTSIQGNCFCFLQDEGKAPYLYVELDFKEVHNLCTHKCLLFLFLFFFLSRHFYADLRADNSLERLTKFDHLTSILNFSVSLPSFLSVSLIIMVKPVYCNFWAVVFLISWCAHLSGHK